MRRLLLAVSLIALQTGNVPLFGQDNPALTRLKSEISKMSDDPMFAYGQIGFAFQSSRGNMLYEYNGDKSLVPASNLKLFTTATALRILGEDFRFETTLSYQGELKDGILNGNLYIQGGGDPTLGSDRVEGYPDWTALMDLWTIRIKEAGIKKINGSIVADPGIFESNSIPNGWIWTDIGNYYGAGATGLMINENLYKLVFKPGKTAGDPTEIIRTEPEIEGLRFENEVRTGAAGSGDNAYIYGAPYSNYRYVSGTVPAGVSEFTIKGSMPDPALFAASQLQKNLVKSGIPVMKASVCLSDTASASMRTTISIHRSVPLKEIIRFTNFHSINLYSEALLKMMAVKKGLKGSTENGLRVMTDYWKGQGIDIKGLTLYDGSGLSPQTALRPVQMVSMLNRMSADTVFLASLPVAGESGTLKKLCKGTVAEGKVFAKSGTMAKVVCYSGYVRSKDGTLNSFAIFVNNYQGTYSAAVSRISNLMVLLTGF